MHNTSVDIFSRYLNVNDKTRNIYENMFLFILHEKCESFFLYVHC